MQSVGSEGAGSEYRGGVLCGALLEIDGKRGVRHYQLPTG
jgi:hypothetical protein